MDSPRWNIVWFHISYDNSGDKVHFHFPYNADSKEYRDLLYDLKELLSEGETFELINMKLSDSDLNVLLKHQHNYDFTIQTMNEVALEELETLLNCDRCREEIHNRSEDEFNLICDCE